LPEILNARYRGGAEALGPASTAAVPLCRSLGRCGSSGSGKAATARRFGFDFYMSGGRDATPEASDSEKWVLGSKQALNRRAGQLDAVATDAYAQAPDQASSATSETSASSHLKRPTRETLEKLRLRVQQLRGRRQSAEQTHSSASRSPCSPTRSAEGLMTPPLLRLHVMAAVGTGGDAADHLIPAPVDPGATSPQAQRTETPAAVAPHPRTLSALPSASWTATFREVFGSSPLTLVPPAYREYAFEALETALARADTTHLRTLAARPSCPSTWLSFLQSLERALLPSGMPPQTPTTDARARAVLRLLQRLYERATRAVPARGHRRNSDYVELWLGAVRFQMALTEQEDAEELRDTFRYLKAERIGEHDPRICELWARFERRLGNERKARKLEEEAAARREAAEQFMRGTCFWLCASSDPENAVPEVVRSAHHSSGHSADAPDAASLLTITADVLQPAARVGKAPSGAGLATALDPAALTGFSTATGTGAGIPPPDEDAPATAMSWHRSVETAPEQRATLSPPHQASRDEHRARTALDAAGGAEAALSSPRIDRDPAASTTPPPWTRLRQSPQAIELAVDAVPARQSSTTDRWPMQRAQGDPEASQAPHIIPRNVPAGVPDGTQAAPDERPAAAASNPIDSKSRRCAGNDASAGHVSIRTGACVAPAAREAHAPTAQQPRGMQRSVDGPVAVQGSAVAEAAAVPRRPLRRLDAGKENVAPSDGGDGTSLLSLPPSLADTVVHVGGYPYIKLEIVGRGGSSKVFKVMCARTRKIFALKRIRIRKADRETLRSYCNEIALLQRLRGRDNIIQLIASEVREHAGLIYLVMEYGEIDLARLLLRNAGRPLHANVLRLYWQQMLEAVHTIHEERIVHSDLKPANFLFVEGVLKLIDFGIAKAIQNDTTNIVRESQVGTLNYMSPEAILDTNEAASAGASGETAAAPSRRRYKLGRPSDIWSLGCILYQMVYGRTPFSHLNVIQKLRCITDPTYDIAYPPVAGIQGIGSEASAAALMDTLRRCLQRDPVRRASIPELLAHPFLNPDVPFVDAASAARNDMRKCS